MCGGLSSQTTVATGTAPEKGIVEKPALEACMVPKALDVEDSCWTSPSEDELCKAVEQAGTGDRRPGRPQQLSGSRPPALDQVIGIENSEGIQAAKTPLAASGVGCREVSPKETKTPLTSKSHIDQWDTAHETLIFFDWDDTLCPTTYIWEDSRLKWNEVAACFADSSIPGHAPLEIPPSTQAKVPEKTMLELFEEHQSAVIALLRLAATLGKVVILTLAEVDWVETSCRNFMPKVLDALEELKIEVVYARKSLSNRFIKRAHEEENDLTKVLKTRAMSRIVKQFYGTNSKTSRSWKNVISIGDSSAERSALQDVVLRREQRDSHGEPKECRCKVIKLISEPSVERLIAQVQVLSTWILTIVSQDGDLDIDFEDFDEDDVESPTRGRRRSTSGQSVGDSTFDQH